MPFVKIMVHAVWRTKNHQPFLIKEIKDKVIAHIKENAREKKIYIDSLNGHVDHLHCLFALNADMALIKALQLLKGESSHWINANKLTNTPFEWADEYYGVSVSESHIESVRHYILTQEEHHKKMTFMEEYERFMKKYNLDGQG